MANIHASTPYSRADDLETLVTAVRLMRLRQREYDADRTNDRQRAARQATIAVDNALAVLDHTGAGMRPLFPIGTEA